MFSGCERVGTFLGYFFHQEVIHLLGAAQSVGVSHAHSAMVLVQVFQLIVVCARHATGWVWSLSVHCPHHCSWVRCSSWQMVSTTYWRVERAAQRSQINIDAVVSSC